MDDLKFKLMRQGGKILAKVLKILAENSLPGKSAKDLDNIAYSQTIALGAKPAFLNYEQFPSSLCVSLNDEIVHGVPLGKKILKEGDLLKLDFGVYYMGYYTDAAITIAVGKVEPVAHNLIKTAQGALYHAIKILKPGMTTGDLGWEIENYVRKNNFFVVKELVGHGIGEKLHQEPQLPNFGTKGQGVILKQGMALAIEPMISAKKTSLIKGEDGFVYKTKDGSLTAHFEHTIFLTEKGAQILTWN
jgi:methionyl aminopeptidase